MYKEYPNLPLIEERFKRVIEEDLLKKKEEMIREAKEKGERYPFWIPDFEAEVFLQIFPNTAGLLNEPGMMSGQALTNQYITVMYEHKTGIYGVFQKDTPVYIVRDANDDFYKDLSNHEMADLGAARERY